MPVPPATPLDKLKSQLAQLDQLITEGTLKGADAKARRDALERQVLAAVAGETDPAAERLPRRLTLAVSAFVLVFGVIAYAVKGNHAGLAVGPGEGVVAAGEGAAADPAQAAQMAQIETMIKGLVDRLKAAPDDAEGWSMLARAYTALGRHGDALPAYKRVLALRPNNAQALVDYADGLGVANNRSLEGEPAQLIAQALKIDPSNVKALSLGGTVAFNKGEYAAAADLWEKALKSADPASDFTRQLQGAVNEARQRAGQGTAANTPATAAASGASISGRVTLAAALQGKVSPGDTVFVFARAVNGPRIPLAILRKKVSDLPLDFKLDDSLAMSPSAKLSGAAEVVVGARISKSGDAMPRAGDWQGISSAVKPGATGLSIEIAQPVPEAKP